MLFRRRVPVPQGGFRRSASATISVFRFYHDHVRTNLEPATISQPNSIKVVWEAGRDYDKYVLGWSQNGIQMQSQRSEQHNGRERFLRAAYHPRGSV
jgi:hypothetical protein